MRRAALICNARSRRGRAWYPAVCETLCREGFELVVCENPRRPARIPPLVRAAIDSGIPLVVIGGGDGTMSACAASFKGRDSVMGVLPLGTGNAFARDLGIPSDVEGACRVLIEGSPRRIDLGIAGGRHFVNVATVGLTTRIAEAMSDQGKARFGRLAYAFAILRAVARVRPFQARLIRPEGSETFETLQIVFGSGRYHAGPFPVTPDAEITDRRLHGYALKTASKLDLLRFALHLGGGRHVDLPDVESFSLEEARLETAPPLRIVLDGEVSLWTPIDLAVDPGAIQVMTAL